MSFDMIILAQKYTLYIRVSVTHTAFKIVMKCTVLILIKV